MTLSPDFSEFIGLLNTHDVRHLVVGGYAVAFHGHPRYTKDLDIWIEPTRENATRLLDALTQFGFSSIDLTVDDFVKLEQTIQLGRPPNRIDLLTSLKGVSFTDSYKSREVTRLNDIDLHFINLNDLKINKKSVGRYQDLADLENLE